MGIVAYVRVSTGGQDLAPQRLAILEYAHRQGYVVDTFITAHASTRRPEGTRQLDTLFEQVRAGDRVLISELSRLGRSVGQIIQLVDRLVKHGVTVISIKEQLCLQETSDLRTKVMITLFGLFAEIERDLIAERTKEGLAAARAQGKRLGRPQGALGLSKLTGRETVIQQILAKTVSKASIAKILGVSRSTLRHFIQSRGLD
jgi:DNA invertase Pin-like site-specific DNA recombinase